MLHLYEACFLVLLDEVRRLDIGAAVTIRGIGHIKLSELEPFLKSTIVSLQDDAPRDEEAVVPCWLGCSGEMGSHHCFLILATSRPNHRTRASDQVEVKNRPALDELDPIFQAEAFEYEPLQTQLEKVFQWAKKDEPDEIAEAYVPNRDERLSFAALQPVTGASQGEQYRLLQEQLYAMEAMDTMQRLKRITSYAEQTLANLVAKVALQ